MHKRNDQALLAVALIEDSRTNIEERAQRRFVSDNRIGSVYGVWFVETMIVYRTSGLPGPWRRAR